MTTEIKCTNCGTINVGELMRCRMCNHPLHLSEAEVRKCPQCSSMATPVGEETCISCGWNFAAAQQVPPELAPEIKPADCEHPAEAELHTVRSFNVDLAVIFMLLAGGLGIIHALLAALPGTSNAILTNYESVIPMGKFLDGVLQDHVAVSMLMFVFGALSIGLSMTALKRSNYAGAVAGAVFGIMSIGFLFGAFFGLMALILLAISKREFLLECP
jgi:hypothetical protein